LKGELVGFDNDLCFIHWLFPETSLVPGYVCCSEASLPLTWLAVVYHTAGARAIGNWYGYLSRRSAHGHSRTGEAFLVFQRSVMSKAPVWSLVTAPDVFRQRLRRLRSRQCRAVMIQEFQRPTYARGRSAAAPHTAFSEATLTNRPRYGTIDLALVGVDLTARLLGDSVLGVTFGNRLGRAAEYRRFAVPQG
jgi:hypothetical protein